MADNKTVNNSFEDAEELVEISEETSQVDSVPETSNNINGSMTSANRDNSPMFNSRKANNNDFQRANNPALGQRKMNSDPNNNLPKEGLKDKNEPAKEGNQPSNVQNGNPNNVNNPNNGEKQNTPNSTPNQNNNPLPGSSNNKTAPKDNAANKNSVKPKEDSNKKFNPRKNIQDFAPGNMLRNAASKLGLGKNKDDKGSPVKDLAKAGIKNLWTMLPVSAKIAVGATAGGVLILAIIIMIVVGVSTGTAIGSALLCDNPSYTANSADSMSFLCNMSSPFGPEGETGEYNVTSTSGRRIPPKTQNGYGSNFHEGTDVTGIKGKNLFYLYAVADGKIVHAGLDGGYGNAVLINHNDAFYTRYGHLYSIDSNIKVGEEIKAGTKIGVMGNTGNSGGVHLHFELRDKDMNYISANPFFGYSDQGYEDCLDPNANIENTKCDFGYTGNVRYIGRSGFNQICGRTSNYFNNGDNSSCCQSINTSNEPFSELLLEYINKFEGGGKSCQTSNGGNGYLAENIGDGAVTAGHGVTNAVIKRQASQNIIASSGYQNEFSLVGNKYIMKVGGCYNKKLIDQLELLAIQEGFGAAVVKSAEKNNVSLQSYEIDALTSFNYNLGSGHTEELLLGYKDGGYEGLWNVMKNYVHVNGNVWAGLQKRRKAEFALFVTGDYTDKGLFYSRNVNNYDDFDSENVIARKATGSASSCDSGNSLNNAVVEKAIEEMKAWNSIAQDSDYCPVITKYMAACGYNGVADYCAGFATYVLKETGAADKIGLPSYSCIVGDFKNTKNGTIHQAGSSYIPKTGDLIIYNGDGPVGSWGHIEIVEKVEGNSVYSIGGNTTGPKGIDGYCGEGNINERLPVSLSDDSITAYISY